MKFFESDTYCTVLVSGDVKELGRIIRCSKMFTQMMGYFPEEVINLKVNVLIPDPITSIHDMFLQNFLVTGTATFIDRSMALPVVVKGGYIENFLAFIKPLIDLKHGLYFVGFFKKLNQVYLTSTQEHLMPCRQTHTILADHRGTIFGVSKSLVQEFNFPNETTAQHVEMGERISISKISRSISDNEFTLEEKGHRIELNFPFRKDAEGVDINNEFIVFCGLSRIKNRYSVYHELFVYRFVILQELNRGGSRTMPKSLTNNDHPSLDVPDEEEGSAASISSSACS